MAKENFPVASSAIARLDYDDETQECFFTFQDGRSYTAIIPPIEVHRWANAESVGGYFNANIRGKY